VMASALPTFAAQCRGVQPLASLHSRSPPASCDAHHQISAQGGSIDIASCIVIEQFAC